jgi:hypothetical protein
MSRPGSTPTQLLAITAVSLAAAVVRRRRKSAAAAQDARVVSVNVVLSHKCNAHLYVETIMAWVRVHRRNE